MRELVNILKEQHKTISTMESCTGGAVASSIIDVDGVLEFGAVTYSKEFKIKMGVSPEVIEKYSVYSMETAQEMSKVIANFSNANYGVGITGHIDGEDKSDNIKDDNLVYISIYDRDADKYNNFTYKAIYKHRRDNKHKIIDEVVKHLKDILINS